MVSDFFYFFREWRKIIRKKLAYIKKLPYLCSAFKKSIGLSHGVMVALQFLVLSVEVRILVRQQSKIKTSC